MQPVRSLAMGKFAGAFRRKAGKNIDTETVKSGGGRIRHFVFSLRRARTTRYAR